MIDLRNIAQQLRLPADQLRLAADLLEQGYQPAFIARYRADETGNLPEDVLWSLKLAIDREQQLAGARAEALKHLGDGVELDDEGRERLAAATTTVEIDVAMRCFRARRAVKQTGDRASQASQLLEKMIAQAQPVPDLNAWVAAQSAVEPAQVDSLLQQASRLVGSLLTGDTRLLERVRRTIQKKANVHVELITEQPSRNPAQSAVAESATTVAGAAGAGEGSAASADAAVGGQGADAGVGAGASSESRGVVWSTAGDDDTLADHDEHADDGSEEHADEPGDEQHDEQHTHEEVATPTALTADAGADTGAGDVKAGDADPSAGTSGATDAGAGEQPAGDPAVAADTGATSPAAVGDSATAGDELSLSFAPGGKKQKGKSLTGKRKERDTAKAAKSVSKLTPRQRRRRWLTSVLQPFKSMKKPLHRLTAYQMLMLGRGQRSQLTKVELQYDRRPLVQMARDTFVADSHPLAGWFASACEHSLNASLLPKIESDALAEQDEQAQQRLLESATDQLRVALMQRPVRGHRILVIDTVGPKSACVAIVDARGRCLVTEEVVCSSQPSVVSQNVIQLGELVHKHKVTLVALSNGPARRFLIHTVSELMRQSASSNLRWTMVDRGGAEAYATSRHASLELPQLNRRFRAAVWLGRRLQDPLGELLKVDPSRLRLGSFQRELPQEALKRLVASTLADCVCVQGVDARYGTEQQFAYVPGVTAEVAQQLGELAAARAFTSREALSTSLSGWGEAGKRQALGFLRIYNSPEVLDGTLIHPDDYHLAQRLLQNTELTAPPSAPAGWQPPKVKQPKSAARGKSAAAEAAQATAVPADVTHSEVAGAAGDQTHSGDNAAPEDAANTADVAHSQDGATPQDSANLQDRANLQDSAAAATHDALTVAVVGADVSQVADGSQAADSSQTVAVAAAVSTAAGADEGIGEATPEAEAVAEATAPSAPEYPEDILAQQAQAPVIDVEKLARGWQVGRAKLAWVANCLSHPFSDVRVVRPPVPMLSSVPTLADLQPGQSVYAIVVGVADFGAFVELGPDCGGLIHISRLSSRYIEDPHQAVQIGDLLQAWVVSVDVDKKRVALTTLSPEEQRQAEQAAAQQREHSRAAQGQRQGQRGGPGAAQSGSGGRGGQGRPGGNRSGDQRGGRPQHAGGSRQGGGPGGPGGRGRGRGGRPGGRDEAGDSQSRPVIVKSKKPAKPITEAMQKGQEPLRSFSDLLQFYELQRDPTTPNPGQANPGQANPGQANPGQANSGQANSGQANSGQANSGQANSGQANSGQANSGQAGSAPAVKPPAESAPSPAESSAPQVVPPAADNAAGSDG
jgi:protein Tex